MNDKMPDRPAVRRTREGALLMLTLDRPATRNALTDDVRAGLVAGFAEAKHDPTVRALVLTGAGGAFCAGGDLRALSDKPQEPAVWRDRMQEAHRWITDLITLPCPVIAAVDGPAYGAGFSLALAADIVLATPAARFCLSFMKLGVIPDLGALYTLPRAVGTQRAKELMLSAREVDADEALRLGIAMELHAPDRLLDRARELAVAFAAASPLAVGLVKRATVDAGALAALLDAEANAQALALSSAYFQDAARRFLDKEPPAFRWPAKT